MVSKRFQKGFKKGKFREDEKPRNIANFDFRINFIKPKLSRMTDNE